MKRLRTLSRIIVGLVFIFSGTTKAIDPLGSAFKFQDYFLAFGLEFLRPLALPLAILLCTAEFIAGFSVLSGYRQRTGIWGVFLLMLIFTPLTLVLAISNPVSDCGCFGDAIHLTNWQTFSKNLVLLFFTLILFSGRSNPVNVLQPFREWSVITILTLLFVVFSILNLRYLPLIDFLPYKTGVNIPEKMIIPEDKPADEYETTFIYQKDGIAREFTLENYPADDTTWKFVEQKSVLVKKGYEPPIHDFIISTTGGEDITNTILGSEGYTMLMISAKLEEARPARLENGLELGNYCRSQGIDFYVVTASGSSVTDQFINDAAYCTADETTLKTIVRANPGYLLLKSGTIEGKWSWAGIPEKEMFSNSMLDNLVNKLNNKSSVLIVYTAGLSAAILFLLICSLFYSRRIRKDQ